MQAAPCADTGSRHYFQSHERDRAMEMCNLQGQKRTRHQEMRQSSLQQTGCFAVRREEAAGLFPGLCRLASLTEAILKTASSAGHYEGSAN